MTGGDDQSVEVLELANIEPAVGHCCLMGASGLLIISSHLITGLAEQAPGIGVEDEPGPAVDHEGDDVGRLRAKPGELHQLCAQGVITESRCHSSFRAREPGREGPQCPGLGLHEPGRSNQVNEAGLVKSEQSVRLKGSDLTQRFQGAQSTAPCGVLDEDGPADVLEVGLGGPGIDLTERGPQQLVQSAQRDRHARGVGGRMRGIVHKASIERSQMRV